jgi:glucosyl-dolichyl phosphate glucuronosyltransferase
MSQSYDISIVISTYNRCDMLANALRSALAQDAGAVRHEVVVVDNKSTDRTAEVAHSLIAEGHANLRYVFEPKQGLSHGRNAGIAQTSAPILAFTDDDICVPPGWVAAIKHAFDREPEIDFLGGKVLPRWPQPPPSWLNREHWTPLALVDYGDEPFYVNTSRPVCLVGANLSMRRRAFDLVGLFTPEFQRVKDSVGSLEDLEMLQRLWRKGRYGLYLPELVVEADVSSDRLEKSYHRRWYSGHGRFHARLRSEEMERSNLGHWLGVPAHLYRQVLSEGARCMVDLARGTKGSAFLHESRMRFAAGFIAYRWREYVRGNDKTG